MEDKLKELDKRIESLENILKDFMENYGPDVQKKRAERDERWDEMVRVLTIQKKRSNEKQSTE
tara:strand:- start:623 stop:811 length:189 start_codon:yes stop_codon:yes gene_type:complete